MQTVDALSQNFSPLAHPGSLPSAAVSLYAWLIPRGSRGTRPPRMSFRRLLGSEIVTVEPMSVPRTSYGVVVKPPCGVQWCVVVVWTTPGVPYINNKTHTVEWWRRFSVMSLVLVFSRSTWTSKSGQLSALPRTVTEGDDHSLTMVEIMTIDCLGNVPDNRMIGVCDVRGNAWCPFATTRQT